MWELKDLSLSPYLTTYLLNNYEQVAIAFAYLAFISPFADGVLFPLPHLLDDYKR